MDCLLRHFFRHGHNIQRQLRLAAHGVDIRKRIGRGNGPEGIRVIRDRREEIHRLHQGQIVGDLVDRGVIALIEAHQQLRVVVHLDIIQ